MTRGLAALGVACLLFPVALFCLFCLAVLVIAFPTLGLIVAVLVLASIPNAVKRWQDRRAG